MQDQMPLLLHALLGPPARRGAALGMLTLEAIKDDGLAAHVHQEGYVLHRYYITYKYSSAIYSCLPQEAAVHIIQYRIISSFFFKFGM